MILRRDGDGGNPPGTYRVPIYQAAGPEPIGAIIALWPDRLASRHAGHDVRPAAHMRLMAHSCRRAAVRLVGGA